MSKVYFPYNDNIDPHVIKPCVQVECDICHKQKLCVRTFDSSTCIDCWSTNCKRSVWTKTCEICENLFEECVGEISCEECKKTVGSCCTALYYCQSNWGTCKKCFDYICVECDDNGLCEESQYVGDASEEDSTYPACEDCRIKK